MLIKKRINTTTTKRNEKTEQMYIIIVLCILWNYSCKNRRLDPQMRSNGGIYEYVSHQGRGKRKNKTKILYTVKKTLFNQSVEKEKSYKMSGVQNWRCGIHIEKNLKSHFRDPKKNVFSISYFEKCFYTCGLCLLQTLVYSSTKFPYTLLYRDTGLWYRVYQNIGPWNIPLRSKNLTR